MLDQFPKVSILIPTLNSASVLVSCLESIAAQDWDKNFLEIIIADGGSTDETLLIAHKYGAIVVPNPLMTAEAGKMCALKHATGEYVALIDSDNILPTKDWLQEMITPLIVFPKVVGSEPWSYTWRPTDGFISRYCALIGMNDPIVLFLGNYDRVCTLTGRWTDLKIKTTDYTNYLLLTFNNYVFPTIGANGTVFRRDVLLNKLSGDYFFDIDVLSLIIRNEGQLQFVKVKNEIIHTYCESNIFKFYNKQLRRVRDYLYFKSNGMRKTDWNVPTNLFGYLYFVLCCLLVLPLLFQAIYGYFKKPDLAWLFHPFACELTLLAYGIGTISSFFNNKIFDRSKWKQ